MDSFFGSLGYGNFVIVLCVLIFVHELGHYLVARMCGVRVEVFSIGFGKELFGWNDKSGTRWKVSLIPLGGYVKMFGEASTQKEKNDHESTLDDNDIRHSFAHKTLAQRAAVVAAGPAANFIFAIFALAAMFFFVGKPVTPDFMETGIGSVTAGSVAEDAGFRIADKIQRVDDIEIKHFSDLVAIVTNSQGKTLNFEIIREGAQIYISAAPRKQIVSVSETETKEIYRLGIGTSPSTLENVGFGESIWAGTTEAWSLTVLTLDSVIEMLKGKVDACNMGGPIKIAQMSSDVGDQGGLAILFFMAILSINLGLLNLFPVPMLDGGHLVFYGLEAIMRRPLSAKLQEILSRIGVVLLLALMILVTWNDIFC